MTTVVIALLTFVAAFLAGAVLSKAYFAVHGGGVDEQRSKYRKRIDDLQAVIRRHEESQAEIRNKLETFRKKTVSKARSGTRTKNEAEGLHATVEDLEGKLALLRVERDELLARIQRLESEGDSGDGQASHQYSEQQESAANLRAQLGELRENLAARDRQVREAKIQLGERDARIRDLTARLESWKQRVSPLTAKLKQQRNLIREFREMEAAYAARHAARSVYAERDNNEPADNLKRIRGIGPALERRLHRNGVRRFEHIADLSEEELADVAKKLAIAPNLAQRDRWIEQARDLIEERSASA